MTGTWFWSPVVWSCDVLLQQNGLVCLAKRSLKNWEARRFGLPSSQTKDSTAEVGWKIALQMTENLWKMVSDWCAGSWPVSWWQESNSIVLFIKTWRSNCLEEEMENFDILINSVIGRSFGVGIKTQSGCPAIARGCNGSDDVSTNQRRQVGKRNNRRKNK